MANHNEYHNGHYDSNSFQSNGFSHALDGKKTEESKDEINLKQVYFTLWHNKLIIVGSILICGLIAGLIAYGSTPIYQSKGSLLIENPQGGAFGGSGSIGKLLSSSYGLGAGSTLANELQVLQSRKLSLAIADSLMEKRIMQNVRQYPTTFASYPDDSTMASKTVIAGRIRRDIQFSKADRESNVVNISYESPSPYEAAFVVNAAMKLYKSISTRENRSSASSAVAFLERERDRIKGELNDAEQQLRNFMNSSNLVEVDSQTKELIQQMADLETSKQEAKAKLVALNSAIDQYESKLNTIKPGLAEQYSEAVGPNIQRLQYAKSELQLQKQQLLSKNPQLDLSSPQLKELDRKIKSYKEKIKSLTQNLVDGNDQYLGFLGGSQNGVAENVATLNQNLIQAKVEREQYSSQLKVINSQLQEQQHFFNNLPDNIVDFAKLKRDVKINEQLYETVSQQYAETALWKQTQFGLGRLIDQAYIPHQPVKPNTTIYVLIGFIIGGIFSIGYVFVEDTFNDTLNGVEWLKELRIPLLAVIPQISNFIDDKHAGKKTTTVQGHEIDTGMVTILDSISPVSESYRRLQNNLLYSNPDTELNSVILTSSGKGEGKTTTISNLAVVLAEAGHNVALVDMDLRRPNVHNMFGLNMKPGIVEVLFDDLKLDEAVQDTIVPGLSVLCAGRRPPNPSAVTQSEAFLKIIRALENTYDYLLIDTPPVGIITDAAAVIREVDGVAVVAKFNETTKTQLSETLNQLKLQQTNTIGTVLTAFDHTESKDYTYGSGYFKDVYQDYNSYQDENI